MDKALSVKDLIEAGVHLGHKSDRWNPKMKPFIFAERKGIHVIDPEKTIEFLNKACESVRKAMSEGATILFVGTKKQIADIVKEEALRCGAFYCTQRWLGGTLTNFVTIRKTVDRMKLIEAQKEENDRGDLTKKEILSLERMLKKMQRNLEGIKDMDELPGIVYITDIKKDKIAVDEAVRLKIPIIGIVDTNVDPEPITFPIPGNDDAIKSVRLITQAVADSVLEGKAEFKRRESESRG
ncbi:MAG: 30S ribosomal protein S2 [bacterium]|nr:30S ribosomal protein S2 [bacterium]